MPRLPALSRLPFWLLILAWFCANTPQTAAWHAIQWLKHSGEFSHQAGLRAEVEAVLAGRPSPVASRFTAPESVASKTDPEPVDVAVKKIPLWRQVAESFVFVAPGSENPRAPAASALPAPVEDVPHPPPRRLV